MTGGNITKKRSLPVGTIILTVMALAVLPILIVRYLYGLGAISNLSDGRPWGLWISFDLYCGVALAAGGFTMAATVYIFNRQKYHPIVRPAIMTAFLGYVLVILALLVDLGQPWYIWHAFINWNIHSPLFEVAMCVITYTFVLALEFSPAVFERLHWDVPLLVIRAVQIPLVIAGITLSTLHQSSLGSMLLLVPTTLSPLWYTPMVPILFLCSAIAVGPAMVILEATLSSKSFGHEFSLDIFAGLGRALPFILGLYLILKILSLYLAGNISLIFTEFPVNLLWWGEMLIGVIIPIVLFSLPAVLKSRRMIFVGSIFVIAGLVFNRLNASWLGIEPRADTFYYPHWMEFAVSIGLIVIALLVIQVANRLLPIVTEEEYHLNLKAKKYLFSQYNK